ncbi:28S ribosomal protein S17, mitochondrial [Toxorhynchites rutilus septentrionalis]|uniref:28S ribosomal protein S17, mitochondrial n=1 Tax=Toxorhynchites rutilus septentrionalis TaxID=329112 RepID=UPI00247AABC6|nr:28S ribosomal protein S17, mitochondrial [Toxorhynchites rutilus septentrionalis]
MASRTAMLLGQVIPCVKQNASKIRVRRMDLDTKLNMYFKKDEFYFVHDPSKKCKTGDIVLIKELPEKLTKLITHAVEEIVYPLGDVTDPITGKKVSVGKYRDDIEETNRLFGKSKEAFDYDKAPPRGRLEGTKDFTHGETYIKYHEDGKEQPFAV